MAQTKKRTLSRRDFVKATTAVISSLVAVFMGLPSLAFLLSPAFKVKTEADTWISPGLLENYPVGVPTFFSFVRRQQNGWEKTVTSYGVFVLRKDDGEVRVFSNICTHLGCRVRWHPELQHYVSPCHNGHFDILGNVVSGPPPRPLDEFRTKIGKGILYVLFPPFRRS